MWKTLVIGAILLQMVGFALAYARQPSRAERSHDAPVAVSTDACIAALKAPLKPTTAQERNQPAVEQAIRDNGTDHVALDPTGHQSGGIKRDHADTLATWTAALKRLVDGEHPRYESLDEAKKHRFPMAARYAARRPIVKGCARGGRVPDREG